MAMLPSSLLLLIYASSTVVNAYSLSSDITSTIPSCAQVCFESFVQDNFPTVCGDTPSLDCLCENESKSTYTVGEGAVQCIMSEASIGFCTGDDSSNDSVLKAYDMCSSDTSALPNTHSTLTATLVLQSGSASIVQIAPVATTGASGSTTTLQTTARATTPAPTGSTSSTGSAQAAATTSSSATPAKSEQSLSTAQIAGIIVAGVGGVSLVIVALLMLACYRRREKAKRDSGYLPFQEEPTMSIKSQSHFGISRPIPSPSPASGMGNGTTPAPQFLGTRAPPRVPLRGDSPSPNPFSQKNAIPDDIGLAMSSETPQNNLLAHNNYNNVEHLRGPSPLLPERPVLTLRVPLRPDSDVQPPISHEPANPAIASRQSVDTQFEDDDSATTAVDPETPWNAYSSMSSGKVLSYGEGNIQTMRAIQHPNPTYYQPPHVQTDFSPNETEDIIDAYKDSSVEPNFYVRPLNLANNFSQPRRPDNSTKPSVNRSNSIQYPLTATSSVYSATSRFDRPTSMEIERLNSLMQSNPSFRRVLHKSTYKPVGPYDENRASTGSMTSFETIDSINAEPLELSGDNNLSPVVESPSSNKISGHSPVTYPKKIRNSARYSRSRRRSSVISSFPAPPPPPNYRPATSHSNTAWQEGAIAAQKERMTLLGLPPLQPPKPSFVNGDGAIIRNSEDFFRSSLASEEPSPPPKARLPLPPTANTDDASSPGGFASKRRNAPPPPLLLGTQSSQSISAAQRPDNSKWRVLPPTNTNSNTNNSASPEESYESSALKSPYWRPQILNNILRKDSAAKARLIAQGRDAEKIQRLQDLEQQDAAAGANAGVGAIKEVVHTREDGTEQIMVVADDNLPKTPGWVPKLTPTRRGNDLFLSVQ